MALYMYSPTSLHAPQTVLQGERRLQHGERIRLVRVFGGFRKREQYALVKSFRGEMWSVPRKDVIETQD